MFLKYTPCPKKWTFEECDMIKEKQKLIHYNKNYEVLKLN